MTTRIIFLDVDKTLVSFRVGEKRYESLYDAIFAHFGTEGIALHQEGYRLFEQGKLDYMGWVDFAFGHLRRLGLTQEIFTSLLKTMEFRSGTKEFFAALHERQIIPVLLTGGFHDQAEIISSAFGVQHFAAATKLSWDNELLGEIIAISFEGFGKREAAEHFCTLFNVDPTECASLGDGRNDIELSRYVGTSFGIEPHVALREVITYEVTELHQIWDNLP